MAARIRTGGFVEPCIPTRALKPPFWPDWVHEIKHDGYRLIARPGLGRALYLRCSEADGGTSVIILATCCPTVPGTSPRAASSFLCGSAGELLLEFAFNAIKKSRDSKVRNSLSSFWVFLSWSWTFRSRLSKARSFLQIRIAAIRNAPTATAYSIALPSHRAGVQDGINTRPKHDSARRTDNLSGPLGRRLPRAFP